MKSEGRKIRLPRSLVYTLLSILLGFIIGALVLALAGYNPFEAYGVLLDGIFGRARYLSHTIIISAPLILTGLSVAFAFRTGLFNIGAEGQYIIGSLAAVLVGYFLKLPAILHIPLTILAGMGAAALWGGLAGFLKARFGVHEVIATIMLNWIALYLNNFMIRQPSLHRIGSEASQAIQDSARIDILGVWKSSAEGLAWRAENPFIGEILNTPVNFGILIAIVAAIVMSFLINRTSLGFELRSVGFNQDAANFGGVPVKRSMTVSMAIAGALAGLAGTIQVMGVTRIITVLAAMEGNGFDGIAVSLIGANSPLGVVLAGLFFGALRYGGTKIQPALGAPREIINIMMGTIVFFVAMPNLYVLIRERFMAWKQGREPGIPGDPPVSGDPPGDAESGRGEEADAH